MLKNFKESIYKINYFKERKIVNKALKNPFSLEKISEEDRNNKKIFNKIFDKMEDKDLGTVVCPYMGEKLTADRDFMLKIIVEKKIFFAFDYASEELRTDKDFVSKVNAEEIKNRSNMNEIKKEGIVRKFKKIIYKINYFKEKKIINEALEFPFSLEKISEADKNNREIFNKIFDKMKDYENIIPIMSVCSFMGEKLKNDKDFMLKIIVERENFFAFDYATKELKNDREFIFEIVKETKNMRILNHILNYVEDEIKNDRDFVVKISKEINSPFILENFNEQLRNDKNFIFELIKERGELGILMDAGEKIRNDKELVFKLIKIDQEALMWAGQEIRNNKDFIFKAIKEIREPELVFCYAGRELRNDKDFIIKAIKETKNPLILKYAPEKLKNDRDFIFKLIEENPTISLNSEVVGKEIIDELNQKKLKEKVEKDFKNSRLEVEKVKIEGLESKKGIKIPKKEKNNEYFNER